MFPQENKKEQDQCCYYFIILSLSVCFPTLVLYQLMRDMSFLCLFCLLYSEPLCEILMGHASMADRTNMSLSDRWSRESSEREVKALLWHAAPQGNSQLFPSVFRSVRETLSSLFMIYDSLSSYTAGTGVKAATLKILFAQTKKTKNNTGYDSFEYMPSVISGSAT